MITINSDVAISNPKIPILGEILIDLSTLPTTPLYLRYSKTTKVYGDCSIYTSTDEPLPNPYTAGDWNAALYLKNAIGDKMFHVLDRFYLTNLTLAYFKVLTRVEEFGNITNLTELNLNGTNIEGDVLELAKLKKLTTLYLALTELKIDVKQLLRECANGRNSGVMSFIAGGVNVTNYPVVGVGDTYAHRCDIYFNESYPDGYYIEAIDGTYYNANGEVITPN